MDQAIQKFLAQEIEQGHIPGANIFISYKGKVLLNKAFGSRLHTSDEQKPMEQDTIFDIASLTKVVSTLPSVLKLIDAGEIRLDDSLQYFFPKSVNMHNQDITIRHLLTHTSGLPAFRPYYKKKFMTEAMVEQILCEKLSHAPGSTVCYSDLGFILLGQIVQKVSGMTLDTFASEMIFIPMGMQDTGFKPDYPENRFAATEYDIHASRFLIGEVHDENARAMGGISGHAGLFSTITDLSKYTKMIENDGEYDGRRILSNTAVQLSNRSHMGNRGLGWEINGIQSSCGDYFSPDAFGHTGFTGTSIWFDPHRGLHVILLTNRVHYGRHPHMIRLRPRLHNLIISQLH